MRKNLYLIGFFLLISVSTFAQANKRIVSLAASITRNLTELGAQKEIVGCTKYCQTDPANSIPVVADAINVNLEKITLLKPDIVIAGGLTTPRTIEALKKMGIQTLQLQQPKNFEELCNQFTLLGKISGKEQEANRIITSCKQRLTAIRNNLPSKSPKVFMEIGNNPLFAALPGTFMHDYIVQAGGNNIATTLSNGSVSKEFVILQDPDIILITAMGIAGDTEKRNWQKLNFLRAVKNDKIYTLPDDICSPTPTSFINTVDELSRLLQK